MNNKNQFQKNATVLGVDGERVGLLDRVVVNPSNNVLTDIVVRTGSLLNQEEKVVPLGLVADANYDQILLSKEAGEVNALPPFKVERLVKEVGEEDSELAAEAERETRVMIAGNPVFGLPAMPTIRRDVRTHVEQNIPEGTVAMKEGAKVYTVDGRHVGDVEGVLADATRDTITHLVISRGLFIRELKMVPIWWVSLLGEEKVQLRVNRHSVENLADLPIAE
jgi:sporulation protein YlmC with PRC-barrel domain